MQWEGVTIERNCVDEVSRCIDICKVSNPCPPKCDLKPFFQILFPQNVVWNLGLKPRFSTLSSKKWPFLPNVFWNLGFRRVSFKSTTAQWHSKCYKHYKRYKYYKYYKQFYKYFKFYKYYRILCQKNYEHEPCQQANEASKKTQFHQHSAPSTRTMSAEGRTGTAGNAILPAFRAFDARDVRRGWRGRSR